jgi:hypothetical protein
MLVIGRGKQLISNRYKPVAFALFIIVFGSCLYSCPYALAQADQNRSKLETANLAIEGAFNSVLDAEKAGANVTNLLSQLNYAVNLMAQAENAFRVGDNNTAVNDADAVIPITQKVTSSAQTLKQSATVNSQNAFWYTIVFTFTASLVFMLVVFLVWRWFKRRYIYGLLPAKPEVKNNGTEVI